MWNEVVAFSGVNLIDLDWAAGCRYMWDYYGIKAQPSIKYPKGADAADQQRACFAASHSPALAPHPSLTRQTLGSFALRIIMDFCLGSQGAC